MPPTLHPHLKRGLDFDDFYTRPEDVVEELPVECLDAEQRIAKRRRIEAIASQYMRGRPPVILTAALRGPFGQGWNNPWTKNKRKRRGSSDKSRGKASSRGEYSRKASSQRARTEGTSTAKVGDSQRKEVGGGIPVPHIASPEASRAAEDDLNSREQDDSFNDVEVPPATAPLPEDDDMSGATEFFSADTGKQIRSGSPMTNSFWLRRPDSAKVDMRKATNSNTEVSPTRSRSRNESSYTEAGSKLQLSLPKIPILAQCASRREVQPEEWKSSASASMVISSPVKSAESVRSEVNAQIHPAIHAEDRATTVRHMSTQPNATQAPTASARPGPSHSNEAAHLAQQNSLPTTLSMTSQGRLSRDDTQRSAERLVDVMPDSLASSKPPRRSSRKSTQGRHIPIVPRHDLVASPAPASSTGFVYRKLGLSRQRDQNVHVLRPRVVDFTSPPALKDKDMTTVERDSQRVSAARESASDPPQETAEAGIVAAHVCQQVGDGAVDEHEEDQDLRTSRSSRSSEWSTQAAVLRAQLEFQQSTFPTMSPEIPSILSQPSQETPRPIFTIPSPVITPLSVVNGRQGTTLSDESAFRGPPISTQDLFGAASPFAFSTVKKKPEGPPRSNLRFTLIPSDHGDPRINDVTVKSPTPSADRIPLKDKNISTSFWSFVTEKASQGSQGSLVDRSRRSVNAVELPHLNFHTSLDDFGADAGLHFTDRFLGNIDDT